MWFGGVVFYFKSSDDYDI